MPLAMSFAFEHTLELLLLIFEVDVILRCLGLFGVYRRDDARASDMERRQG